MRKAKELAAALDIVLLAAGLVVLLYGLVTFSANLGEYPERLFGLAIGLALTVRGAFFSLMLNCAGKKAKKLLYALSAVFFAWLASFVIVCALILSNAATSLPPPNERAAVIVLGAKTVDNQPSLTLKMRLDAAAEYIKRAKSEGSEVVCLVAGGKGENEAMPEGRVMRSYLVEIGVEPELIVVEDRSSNTKENFIFAKQALESALGGDIPQNIIIVTSDFHILRSKLLALRFGFGNFKLYSIAAPTPGWFFPVLLAREYLALFKSLIFDIGIG